MLRHSALGILLLFPFISCEAPTEAVETTSPDVAVPTQTVLSTAPLARVQPTVLEEHGHRRVDDYYWLNQRENPEVIAYLEAENAHLEATMAPWKGLRVELYQEIVGRIDPDDSSVPARLDDWFYSTRYEAGREYPIHVRQPASDDPNPQPTGDEQILLDVNILAEGHEYFSVRGDAVSTDHHLLAYATDDRGRRIYTIHIKDLRTGERLPDRIEAVTGNLAWANDNRTLFYAKQDPKTLRSYQIYKHALGTDPTEDELVFEETDDTFSCFVFKTKSQRFLMIASTQTLSSEYRYLDADQPDDDFQVFLPRERDHEYSLDHAGDHFYVLTNANAQNFRLMKAPVTDPARENWLEVVPHRPDVRLHGVELFADYLVLSERRNGLRQLRVMPMSGGESHTIAFDEPAYTARVAENLEFDSTVLRFSYTSLTTPASVYDYDLRTHQRTLMKQTRVLGGFDAKDYRTDRLFATARDGTRIPVSIVSRTDVPWDGSAPLLLYGYGSYGASMDPSFNAPVLSLLDRGFLYAIAHIRGGEEMGRAWYEDGKLLKKKNTFTDFIDCAEHLAREEIADGERLFAMGGSAGGLLMGAVINRRPDLFRGVVAAVPFVDVVTTMLDDSIPLTTFEYDEWGNPHVEDYYRYMLSYSPYDNVEKKDYPNLLVTTGLHDSQVQYWEPAKWVAKLRARKTDDHLLLLDTNMDAGHGGASGRYKRHQTTALTYAFFLSLVEEIGTR